MIDGRLLIEGTDLLRAMRRLHRPRAVGRPLPGVGAVYDNMPHQPGANAGSSNYVSASDSIYV